MAGIQDLITALNPQGQSNQGSSGLTTLQSLLNSSPAAWMSMYSGLGNGVSGGASTVGPVSAPISILPWMQQNGGDGATSGTGLTGAGTPTYAPNLLNPQQVSGNWFQGQGLGQTFFGQNDPTQIGANEFAWGLTPQQQVQGSMTQLPGSGTNSTPLPIFGSTRVTMPIARSTGNGSAI